MKQFLLIFIFISCYADPYSGCLYNGYCPRQNHVCLDDGLYGKCVDLTRVKPAGYKKSVNKNQVLFNKKPSAFSAGDLEILENSKLLKDFLSYLIDNGININELTFENLHILVTQFVKSKDKEKKDVKIRLLQAVEKARNHLKKYGISLSDLGDKDQDVLAKIIARKFIKAENERNYQQKRNKLKYEQYQPSPTRNVFSQKVKTPLTKQQIENLQAIMAPSLLGPVISNNNKKSDAKRRKNQPKIIASEPLPNDDYNYDVSNYDVNTADDYDVEQPMYDETDGDVTDDVTNRPLLSDEDYDYLFGKDSDRKLSELYDDYVEAATTPSDAIKQPSSDLKPALVQPEPSNIRLEPSKLAEPPVSGVEKSKVEPKPVDPTVIVPVVAAIIIICCGFLSVVIMYCFKIYSVKKSIDGDKPQEVYENKLCGQQRYTDKPTTAPSNQIVPSNQQPSIDTVATQPQPEVTKQPLLHKNSTTSLLTNESVRGRGSISSTITEDPIQTIDISMAHTLLTYMESITSDKLNVEWNQLEEYVADNVSTDVAESNIYLNRNNNVLPFDHNRVLLDTGDYINASYIIDKDPRNPRYITSQAPTNNSVVQTWQLIWQHNITCIVLLTPLSENSTEKCAMYWPCESTMTFGCYEVHLISEHILSEDYVVRSLFVRNTESGHSRTITQFHYLSWPSDDIPSSADQLLDMRRKAAKCSVSSNNPVLVQCDDGSSRSGSYILIDVVLNNLQCSNKHEVDVSSTVEHLRDQRMSMVNSKEQFQFALNAVAEEVNTILKNLLKNDA